MAVTVTAALVKLFDDVWQILTSTEDLPHASDKILAPKARACDYAAVSVMIARASSAALASFVASV
jgi:hypothetical protein